MFIRCQIKNLVCGIHFVYYIRGFLFDMEWTYVLLLFRKILYTRFCYEAVDMDFAEILYTCSSDGPTGGFSESGPNSKKWAENLKKIDSVVFGKIQIFWKQQLAMISGCQHLVRHLQLHWKITEYHLIKKFAFSIISIFKFPTHFSNLDLIPKTLL